MKKFDNYCGCLAVLKRCDIETAKTDEVYRMGVIAQFNLCFELGWKALKEVMVMHSVPNAETGSPRETLKLAFKVGFLDDEEVWLEMLKSRNIITHVYIEEDADRLIGMITSDFLPELERLKEMMEKKLDE